MLRKIIIAMTAAAEAAQVTTSFLEEGKKKGCCKKDEKAEGAETGEGGENGEAAEAAEGGDGEVDENASQSKTKMAPKKVKQVNGICGLLCCVGGCYRFINWKFIAKVPVIGGHYNWNFACRDAFAPCMLKLATDPKWTLELQNKGLAYFPTVTKKSYPTCVLSWVGVIFGFLGLFAVIKKSGKVFGFY